MTASRNVLDGMVPVFTHTPPSKPGFSTTATFLPFLLAEMAHMMAAGPDPMTNKSKSNFWVGVGDLTMVLETTGGEVEGSGFLGEGLSKVENDICGYLHGRLSIKDP